LARGTGGARLLSQDKPKSHIENTHHQDGLHPSSGLSGSWIVVSILLLSAAGLEKRLNSMLLAFGLILRLPLELKLQPWSLGLHVKYSQEKEIEAVRTGECTCVRLDGLEWKRWMVWCGGQKKKP
jgi:hypothetical protein